MQEYALRATGHTGVTVSDLSRSIRFYRDILGCEVSPVVPCSGPFFERVTAVPSAVIDVAFVRLPGHVVELLCFREPQNKATSTLRACDPGFLHLCIKVKNLTRVIEAAAQADFRPLSDIQHVLEGPAKGLSVVYIRDPDGVVLELVEEPAGVVLEELYWPAR